MSNLVKMQAEQSKNEFTSCAHTIGKGLGASLLCLSVLSGCASNPDQNQPVDSAENAIQTEEVAMPEHNAQAEEASTETQISTENDSQEVTTKTASTTSETATDRATDQTTPITTSTTSAAVEEGLTPEAEPKIAELNSEQPTPTTPTTPTTDTTDTTTTAETLAITGEVTAIDAEETNKQAAVGQPLTRSSKNLGKSYGIWTLKDAGNGFCKLKTPTLQIGNKEYSSQIWMDIEEQQIIVNAYMALDIKHPKTGIQIDNNTLMPFAEKVNSTRAVVTGDMTAQLSSGKELHIFINGEEVGKQVLKRNVKLTDMNAAISALRSCSN